MKNNIKVLPMRQQNLKMIQKELSYRCSLELNSKELLDLIVYIVAKNMPEFTNLLCDNNNST